MVPENHPGSNGRVRAKRRKYHTQGVALPPHLHVLTQHGSLSFSKHFCTHHSPNLQWATCHVVAS